jgi:hypothetical protein
VDIITGILASASTNSIEKKLLALELLPTSVDTTTSAESDTPKKYIKIVEEIFNCEDPTIQVHVYAWVRKYDETSPEKWSPIFNGK